MPDGYPTERAAIRAAKKYAKKNGVGVFVYAVKSGICETYYAWCTEWEYYHGPCQWVPEQNVIWNSCDGWY